MNQTLHSILELMDWQGRQMSHDLRCAHVPGAVKEKGPMWGRALSQHKAPQEGFLGEVVFKVDSKD